MQNIYETIILTSMRSVHGSFRELKPSSIGNFCMQDLPINNLTVRKPQLLLSRRMTERDGDENSV